MGYYYNIPLTNRKAKMTNKIDLNNIPDNFMVTYFANKHKKVITRNGSWFKPNTDTVGKAFISKNGVVCFIYWDNDAEPDEKGNQWRMAKNPMTIKATTIEG